MSDGGTADEEDGSGRIAKWILLEGNRFAVAGIIAGGIVVVLYALAVLDFVTLGPQSNVRTLFSSGLTSGLLTLVTVALSINQLLLSRVFGPPKEFANRLSGTEEFRERVSRAAGRSLHQNDPKEFLLALVQALRERSRTLDAELPPDASGDPAEMPAELAEYADTVAETIQSDTRGGKSETMDVLVTLLGSKYAEGLTTLPRLREEYGDDLSERGRVELENVLELVRSVAIFRQFLKTLAIQQDLARLSRLVAYTGVLALVTTFALSLVYTSGAGAVVHPSLLRPVVSLGLGVASLPLALLVSYLLRVATVSRYTVSAGSFVPPEEQFEG